MDFKNTVIIMTTNLGSRDVSKGLCSASRRTTTKAMRTSR